MKPIWIASAASFLIGLFGYIIVMLWLKPISRYRQLKKEILLELENYSNHEKGRFRLNAEKKKLFREYSLFLMHCHVMELPKWYRIHLANRKVNLFDASAHLMKLAEIKNSREAFERVEMIKEALGEW